MIPYVVSFLGAASNQAVLYANHDTFPVRVNAAKLHKDVPKPVILKDGTVMMDSTHCVMTDRTHLNLLADIFDFHTSIESIGDLLIELGTWLSGFCMYLWAMVMILKVYKKD